MMRDVSKNNSNMEYVLETINHKHLFKKNLPTSIGLNHLKEEAKSSKQTTQLAILRTPNALLHLPLLHLLAPRQFLDVNPVAVRIVFGPGRFLRLSKQVQKTCHLHNVSISHRNWSNTSHVKNLRLTFFGAFVYIQSFCATWTCTSGIINMDKAQPLYHQISWPQLVDFIPVGPV